MSSLGSAIAALRYERRLSLQKLADLAGLRKAHVWELEKGRSDNPSVSTLVGLGNALDVPPDELFRAAMK